jgi:hypothetical protein
MKLSTDHGWPLASDGADGHGLEAFKNERDYIAQNGRFKTTVAAMDWAAREIEQLLKEHELMHRTLQTIGANSSDGLQRTQALGALTNIGPRYAPDAAD